jgi:hypothetical protein
MGTNEYAYVYDLIGDQKSAKPKAQPPGDRDFKAARRRGARSGIPRRSGNCYRTAATNDGVAAAYAANALNQYTAISNQQSAVLPTTRTETC